MSKKSTRKRLLVRCDGCGRISPNRKARGDDYVAPCPRCGSETATYANQLR